MMRKVVGLFLIAAALGGCVRKMDVEQGNILTPDMISRVHKGMSIQQVRETLGTPILMNTFSENRLDYVYTFKTGYGAMQEKHLSLIFSHGQLVQIER